MIFFYQLKKRLREGIPALTGGLREHLQVRQCDRVAGSLGAGALRPPSEGDRPEP